MKKHISILALAALLITACGSRYKTLSLEQFESAIAQPNVTVVDVRTPQEFAEGHIAGAINIDWKNGNFAQMADELLDDDHTIALYCIHANRSKQAAEKLLEMGYHNVVELQDGLEAWIDAGKLVEVGISVDFDETDGYLLLSGVALPLVPKIDSRELFDSYFAIAHTDDDEMPRTIDFERQFVVVVALEDFEHGDIDAERLIADGETLTLEYSVSPDDDASPEDRLLLLVVDNQYKRPNVSIKRVSKR